MSIRHFRFQEKAIDRADEHLANWPVVYVIDGNRRPKKVYVGETTSAQKRIRQHLRNPQKRALDSIRVVVDDTYNKSVCLDLEAHLIRWFHGDGQ